MPRYVFEFGGERDPPERVALSLRGPEEARAVAVRAAGEMLGDLREGFWRAPERRMRVTDEAGATVCVLRILGRAGPG